MGFVTGGGVVGCTGMMDDGVVGKGVPSGAFFDGRQIGLVVAFVNTRVHFAPAILRVVRRYCGDRVNYVGSGELRSGGGLDDGLWMTGHSGQDCGLGEACGGVEVGGVVSVALVAGKISNSILMM